MKSVKLSWLNTFQPYVPDVSGFVPSGIQDETPNRHRVLRAGKQIEADANGMPAEDREVDSSGL
jgi:hypothetical protein